MSNEFINTLRHEQISGDLAAPGVWFLPLTLVNVCFIEDTSDESKAWVIVDGGLGMYANRIFESIEERFGKDNPPKAIILTHGHFDHVGALTELSDHFHIPIYAHEEELPYLTGVRDYPQADPSAGGGLMSAISLLYPRNAINLGHRVKPLPGDGEVPFLTEWRWIHTPGHTPGHISLFRDKDAVLVAGDALTTQQQESALAVLFKEKELNGPPAYFTPDWKSAKASVKKLHRLHPEIVISGHGLPMKGQELHKALDKLAKYFDEKEGPQT